MMMPSNIFRENIAVCGVNCLACSAYLSEKNPCPGCTAPEEKHTRKSCKDCLKKDCALDQGLRWCFTCERFPCSKIKSLNNRYKTNYGVDLVENGECAKCDMEAFLKEQRVQFTCVVCGGVVDQHRKKCSECGLVIGLG